MTYEIWDGASGNLLVARSTKNEALAVVREAIAIHGELYVESLALILEDDEGESHLVAEGSELVTLAVANRLRANRHRVARVRAKNSDSEPKATPLKNTGFHLAYAPGQRAPVSGQNRDRKSGSAGSVKRGSGRATIAKTHLPKDTESRKKNN